MIGTWSQFASPEPVDILGAAGFDFTIVDTEHGCFGLETAENLVRAADAAGLVAIVRVPANEGHMITKALDIGAAAVLVPKIGSAEEAERATAATRFGPGGSRGACPCVRSGGHFIQDWRAFLQGPGGDAGIIALIETPSAIERIDEIASVQGLVALLAGPFDLAVAMGLEGETTHPEVTGALERVRRAAVAADLPLIMPIFKPAVDECRDLMAGWMRGGVSLFTVGTDKLLFADYCARYTAALRG
ncbi:MAG TPA: aldolase/citrate lyase family protein [Geminicoccaceae bacterium]